MQLPEYVSKLATEFTVLLTNRNHFVTALATDPVDNQFQIEIEKPAPRDLGFFWHVMGKRAEVQPEVAKVNVTKRGDGPYTWLE